MADVVLGKAKVSVVAETEKHDKNIDKSKLKVKGFGDETHKMSAKAKAAWLAAGAAVAATGVVIAKTVQSGTMEFAQWNSQLLRTEALLKATRYAVGFTTRELSEFAKQRDLATLGDRNNIMSAINVLQTFKSVSSDVFKSTIIQAQNMATIIGGDVKTQIISLGKALEDPIRGLTALRRSGVSFTEDQKKTIKALVESNNLLDAQKMILAEINTQVGGAADAEASGLLGSLDTLSFTWREFKESLEQTELAIAGVDALSSAIADITPAVSSAMSAIYLLRTGGLEFSDLFGDSGSVKSEIDKMLSHPLLYKKNALEKEIETLQAELDKKSSQTWFYSKRAIKELSENLEEHKEILKAVNTEYEKNNGMSPDEIEAATKKKIADLKVEKEKEKALAETVKLMKEMDNINYQGFGAADDWDFATGDNFFGYDEKEAEKERTAILKVAEEFKKDLFEVSNGSYAQELQIIIDLEKKYLDAGMNKVEVAKIVNSKIATLNKNNYKEEEKDIDSFFKGVTENFTSAIQSEMSGVFTDLLTGELDSFEDYFSNFTASLTQMWGQMAAKMVMTQSMWSAGNFAALGVAGVAIAGVSSILSSRAEEKAEEKRLELLRAQTEEQVTGSIASLELSDLDYEIFQMNERFESLMQIAKATGMPLDDLIKLRRLETDAIIEEASAGYDSLNTNIDDWVIGKQRQDWSVSDWQREFNVLSDDLMLLDQTAVDYNDASLEILTDQFEILQNIYDIQESQLSALESTSTSLVAQATALQTTEGMPVDRAYYESQYSSLYSAAITPDANGMLSTTDIAIFQAFINDYIDTMSMLGDDFATLNDQAAADLLSINDAVQSEMEILTAALQLNTAAVEGNTDIISAISGLQDTIVDISDQSAYDAWLSASPTSDWDSFQTSTSSDGINFRYPQLEEAYATMPFILDWLENADADIKDTKSWKDYYNWARIVSDYVESVEAGGVFSTVQLQLLLDAEPELAYGLAKGGLATSTSVIGEAGQPEWGVPAYNNTNNANFLKTVGMDKVLDLIEKNMGNNSQPTSVNLIVDGKKLASVMIEQSRTNPEFKRMLQ